MRIERHENEDGRKCWLNRDEQKRLVDCYIEEPRKQLAIRGGLHGMRAKEISEELRTENIRELSTDEAAHVLRIQTAKSGRIREFPVSTELIQQMRMLKNARGARKDESLIDVGPKQVRRWVKSARRDIVQQTDNQDWRYVTSHDLRRSWATSTYYRLDGNRALEVVMSWGGWQDESVFRRDYLGRPTDALTHALATKAGIL